MRMRSSHGRPSRVSLLGSAMLTSIEVVLSVTVSRSGWQMLNLYDERANIKDSIDFTIVGNSHVGHLTSTQPRTSPK